MYRSYLCILFFLLLHGPLRAQCPDNIGFERGQFSNWQCYRGEVGLNNGNNEMTLSSSAPAFNHHSLVDTADGLFDPYGNFPQTCPYGGRYSVKLGNEETGHEADAMAYVFTVPSNLDTFTITFFYAVVLQNPGHADNEQPRFFVTAADAMDGSVINCSNFDFVANGSIPGFKNSLSDPTVVYKEWTPASLQFVNMAGRDIRLEFRVADCTRGGHFGYAYIDVSENCTGELATAPFCTAANALELSAPYGFENYTWYNANFSQVVGTGQSVVLSPPPPGADYFWVDLEPYPGYGCRDTLKARVAPYPTPDTVTGPSDLYYCLDQMPVPLTATASNGSVLLWYDVPTGGAPSLSAPTPPTGTVGLQTFWVSQKQLFGCEGPRKEVRVHVFTPEPLSLTVNSDRQCFNGNSFVFTNTTRPIQGAIYWWVWGDAGTDHAPAFVPRQHTYIDTGTFQAKLHITNGGACSGTLVQNVTVVPNPTAVISGPPSICIGAAGAVLSDSSLTPGSTVAQWWWNVGGVTSTAPQPPLPSISAGPVAVALVVTTPEGCRSDTARSVLPVHNRPVAAFSFAGNCDNEPFQLRDASFQPPNVLGEQLDRWTWSADNTPLSMVQSPDVLLSGGTHTVRLVVTNNFGCNSDPADSLVTLAAHPRIAVTLSDSCAGRPIEFAGSVLSGTVRDWRWNLGSGWITAGSVLRQTYLQGGTRSMQLIATAPDGCRDTVQRLVPVLVNTAWAGNDTAAAYGEPLLLNGHGDSTMHFTWTPANALNDAGTQRPTAVWPSDLRYELYAVDRYGCESRSSVLLRRYSGPDLYVPNAFTPNGDGRNDRLQVRPVGIRTLHFFAIYDRGGHLLFRSTDAGKGWDGTSGGVALASQTFVYVAEGTDFNGQKVFRKGTVTLLR